jgi:hypothetical protein
LYIINVYNKKKKEYMPDCVWNPPLSDGSLGSYVIVQVLEEREEDAIVALKGDYDREKGLNVAAIDKERLFYLPTNPDKCYEHAVKSSE